jgi:hypothetical protein
MIVNVPGGNSTPLKVRSIEVISTPAKHPDILEAVGSNLDPQPIEQVVIAFRNLQSVAGILNTIRRQHFLAMASFHNMTKLIVKFFASSPSEKFSSCPILLDDKDIADMTRSWPNLEVLRLDPWSPQSRVTHVGLTAVLSNCPGLRILHLIWDAFEVPSSDERYVLDGVQSLTLSHLGVARGSEVGDPRDVVWFIKHIAPKLKKMELWAILGSPSAELWREVAGFVHPAAGPA